MSEARIDVGRIILGSIEDCPCVNEPLTSFEINYDPFGEFGIVPVGKIQFVDVELDFPWWKRVLYALGLIKIHHWNVKYTFKYNPEHVEVEPDE